MIELLNQDIVKIFTVFSLSPGSRLRRKLLKEKTGMNNIILDKNLNMLVNFKILNINKNLFSINFENNEAKELIGLTSKEYAIFKQLPLKEYFLILKIKEELAKIENIQNAYLFGSYAKLIFNEKSDIDIAIVSDYVKKEQVNSLVKKIEKKCKKTIEIHYFTCKFYSNKRDALVKEILQHGIKLV